MKIIRRSLPTLLVAALAFPAATPAEAATLACSKHGKVEELRYSWQVRGGVRLLAGFFFPTSGVGNLRTTLPADGEHAVESELLITAPQGREGGFYSYESTIDRRGAKTLVTSHGYAWGEKSRTDRTVFDYDKGLARRQKHTSDNNVRNKVTKLPKGDEHRDILTAIYFLRQNAHSIATPLETTVYSDGKQYPVVFRPLSRKVLSLETRKTPALGFEIVDAPGGKKWPGGVKVWLSDDERRIPVRIEIRQSIGALQLDLQSVESCADQIASLRPL